MPFRQYWVTTATVPGPSYQDRHYLYRFDAPTFEGCIWKAVTDHLAGPSTEELQFYPWSKDDEQMSYAVELVLAFPLGVNVWRGIFSTALPETGDKVEPEAPTSCSRQKITLPHIVFGLVSPAVLTPAYPDACSDDDYPEKEQRKFLASF